MRRNLNVTIGVMLTAVAAVIILLLLVSADVGNEEVEVAFGSMLFVVGVAVLHAGLHGGNEVTTHTGTGDHAGTADPAGTAEPVPPSRGSTEYRQAVAVAAAITDDIRTGRSRPGLRLPAERELVAEYQTSLLAIHTALTILRDLGLVRASGEGALVVSAADGGRP